MQRAGAARRGAVELDERDATLLEVQDASRAKQSRAKVSEVRLVTDQRQSPLPTPRVLRDGLHDVRCTSARRKPFKCFYRRFARQTGCQELGRFARADEGAGDDEIDRHVQLAKPGDRLAKPRNARWRQRSQPIVGIRRSALGCNGMSHEIKLQRRGHSGQAAACGRRRASSVETSASESLISAARRVM